MAQELWANQAGSYSAEITRRAVFAQYARTAANSPGIIAGGLIATGDLALSAPASGMSVNVAAGECIVGGTSGGAQGGYYGRNTAQQNLAITAANATNPRIDTVVATVADAGYGQPSDVGATTNGLVLAVVTGTPTAGATLTNLSGAAAVPLSSLVLGYVLVPANATNITTADLATVAGVVADANALVTGTDAAKPAGTAANRGQFYEGTDSGALYVSDGSALRTVYGSRGAVSIATSQSTSSTTYVTLATPDQVTGLVLPTNGLLAIGYQATWQESVSGAARAAIFVGSSQIRVQNVGGASPGVQEAQLGGTAAFTTPLGTFGVGLVSATNGVGSIGSDVTTGQIVGDANGGGLCYVFAAAGTYTISIQFKASSGSVTASNRKLWVMAIPFA